MPTPKNQVDIKTVVGWLLLVLGGGAAWGTLSTRVSNLEKEEVESVTVLKEIKEKVEANQMSLVHVKAKLGIKVTE